MGEFRFFIRMALVVIVWNRLKFSKAADLRVVLSAYSTLMAVNL